MFKTLAMASALVAAATACTYYTSTYTFPAGQYPTIWQMATTTVFSTAEFQTVYNSINWTAVPNIAPRTMGPNGFVLNGYNVQTDPDCWWSASLCTTPKAPGLIADTWVCPEPDTLGLTYDDGPNCTDTELYDFLKENNQKVTLFYIGSNVADWPQQAQRGYADGHQICVHTWSHPYMTTLTNQEVVAELYYTRKAIKYVIGITPLCWRPPYGDVDDRVRAIAQQLGLTTIIWDQDTDDWEMIPAGTEPQSFVDAQYQGIVTRGQNGTYATHGSIILSHELNNGTITEAIKWYPMLKTGYKNIVPVATCMNTTHPYLEANVSYPTFAQYVGLPSSNMPNGTNGTSPTGTGNSSSTVTGGPVTSTHSSASSLHLASALGAAVVTIVSAFALL